MPACLPEQLCWSARGRVADEPALELVLGRRRLREQRAHGLERLRPGEVRRGGDREVAVVEIVARARERQRLERLRRRAHEGDERRVAGRRHDGAVAHRDGVHAVDRLDQAAAAHDYADRAHAEGA